MPDNETCHQQKRKFKYALFYLATVESQISLVFYCYLKQRTLYEEHIHNVKCLMLLKLQVLFEI